MTTGIGWFIWIAMFLAWAYAGYLAFDISSEIRSRILALKVTEGRKAELLMTWRCLFMAVYVLIFFFLAVLGR